MTKRLAGPGDQPDFNCPKRLRSRMRAPDTEVEEGTGAAGENVELAADDALAQPQAGEAAAPPLPSRAERDTAAVMLNRMWAKAAYDCRADSETIYSLGLLSRLICAAELRDADARRRETSWAKQLTVDQLRLCLSTSKEQVRLAKIGLRLTKALPLERVQTFTTLARTARHMLKSTPEESAWAESAPYGYE